MRKIEIAIVLLILPAVFMKSLHIEGMAALTVILFLVLSLLYLLFGFMVLNNIPMRGIFKASAYAGLGWRRIAWSVIAGIILSLSVIALLFPVMNWEGVFTVVVSAGLLLLPVFIISFICCLRGSKRDRNILVRVTFMLIIAIIALKLRYPLLGT